MGTKVKRVVWWGLNAYCYLIWVLKFEVAIQAAGYSWLDTVTMMVVTPLLMLVGWWEWMGYFRVRVLRNWL